MKKYSRLITGKYEDHKTVWGFMKKDLFVFSNNLNQIMYEPETCPEGKLVGCSAMIPATMSDPGHKFLPDFEMEKYETDDWGRVTYYPRCFKYCRRIIEK